MTVACLEQFSFRNVEGLTDLLAFVDSAVREELPFVLLGGGTDFMVEQEMRKPYGPGELRPTVVDISRLSALRGIELHRGPSGSETLIIGAETTYLELRKSALVTRHAPMLAVMAADVGALQIQARGTLGGNLATGSPAADGVAALAAYDAAIVVESVRGARTIALTDLQTGYKTSSRAPDEVIVKVLVPVGGDPPKTLWRKIGTRRAQAISKVAFAAVASSKNGQAERVGFGMASVGPTTALLPRTRELFLSTPLRSITAADIDKAVEADISPLSDVRSTAAYRLHVAKAMVRQFAQSLARQE